MQKAVRDKKSERCPTRDNALNNPQSANICLAAPGSERKTTRALVADGPREEPKMGSDLCRLAGPLSALSFGWLQLDVNACNLTIDPGNGLGCHASGKGDPRRQVGR